MATMNKYVVSLLMVLCLAGLYRSLPNYTINPSALIDKEQATKPIAEQDQKRHWLQDIQGRERKVFSQKGQDGVLEYIFSKIGTTQKYYVELGFNSRTFEGGSGSNTYYMYSMHGWRGLLIDGKYENETINLHSEIISPDNIVKLFDKYGVPKEPDYVSVDIDSVDLGVFKAIIESYRPRVLTVEYNPNFPFETTLSIDYTLPARYFFGLRSRMDASYGASLAALDFVGRAAGYTLVHVISHLDAFFIRSDIIPHTDSFVPPLTRWRPWTCRPNLQEPLLERLCHLTDSRILIQTGNATLARLAAHYEIARFTTKHHCNVWKNVSDKVVEFCASFAPP